MFINKSWGEQDVVHLLKKCCYYLPFKNNTFKKLDKNIEIFIFRGSEAIALLMRNEIFQSRYKVNFFRFRAKHSFCRLVIICLN